MEKSFSAGAIDNGSSGNRHECVVLHNLPKLCTALRFRGMGSWNRTVFSALSAVCCGAAMLEFVLRAQKQLPALYHAASEN